MIDDHIEMVLADDLTNKNIEQIESVYSAVETL